jgi:hypothetical protein
MLIYLVEWSFEDIYLENVGSSKPNFLNKKPGKNLQQASDKIYHKNKRVIILATLVVIGTQIT